MRPPQKDAHRLSERTGDGVTNPTTVNNARLDAWLEALATETDMARKDAALTAYFGAMARFWRYSQQNSLLIFMQRPAATYVNSKKRWLALGYTLKPGTWTHGIGILCPHFKTVTDDATGEEKEVLTHFSTGYIYDVADMEAGPQAQPLTAPWQALGGDHEALYALLIETCHMLRISVTLVDDMRDTLHGDSDGRGHIRLNARDALGNRAETLLHEVAHEVVHPRAMRERGGFTRQEVECQAEAIAFCCGRALGLETPNSGVYLALYHVGREELRKNAQAIAVGVQTILRAVERASEQTQEVAA